MGSRTLQELVVDFAVLLQIEAQVEQWLVHDAEGNQGERNKQSPESAVAIEVGMNRFKLGMRAGDSHERQFEAGLVVEVAFEILQAIGDFRCGRGHEARVARSRPADPVLRLPEQAGL